MLMRTDRGNAARFRAIALIAIIVVGGLITPLQIWHNWSFATQYRYDFALFDQAFRSVWYRQSVTSMYSVAAEHRWLESLHYPIYAHQHYVYPPQFAVLLCWLGALPFRAAAWIWMGAAGLSWVGTAILSVRLANLGRARLPRVLLVLAALLFEPFWVDALVANSNWLIALLVAVAMYASYGPHKRPWLAGATLGLAIVFKVTPAVILLLWLARGYWKTAACTLVTIVMSTVVTMAVLGWRAIPDYVARFGEFTKSSMQNGPAPYNSSLKGVLGLWQAPHGPLSATQVTLGFDVYLVLVVVLLALSIRGWAGMEARREAALVSLAPLLVSPLLELPQMMTMYLSLACLVGLWWADASLPTLAKVRVWEPPARFFIMTFLCLDFSTPVGLLVGNLVHLPIAYFIGLVTLFTGLLTFARRLPRREPARPV